MIGRMLLRLILVALAGFVALALIGLWDRYSQEAAALGFRSVYEWHRASQANSPDGPRAYRAAAGRGWQAGNVAREATTLEE
jgi:hypothetical protein